MSKTQIWIFFFLFFISSIQNTNIFAQNNVSPQSWESHLDSLKSGILLVRLKNVDEKIEKLKAAGKAQKVAEVKEKNEYRTAELSKSFKEYWDFCDVLFFYSTDSKKIVNLEFEDAVFDTIKNSQLKIQTTRPIYILDFGTAMPAGESSSYNGEGLWIRHLEEGKLFLIESDLFYQMAPYKILGDTNRRQIEGQVIEFNRNLFHKYQKMILKKKKKELKNKIKNIKNG